MGNWTPATLVKLLDIAKKIPVEKRYNTYYIRGFALVQCNAVSINVTVKGDHLHMFYDPILNTYHAYTMPIFQTLTNAYQLFVEGKHLCEELEKLVSGPPSLPTNTQNADLDTILARLNLITGKVQARGEMYYKAKDYVKSHYPECFKIVKYFRYNKPALELLYSLYAGKWDTAESVLNVLAMGCSSPECVSEIGDFFNLCRETISKEGKT